MVNLSLPSQTPSDDTGFFYYCKIHGRRMSGNVMFSRQFQQNLQLLKCSVLDSSPNVTIAVGDTVKWVMRVI
jgi:hypothetical protein